VLFRPRPAVVQHGSNSGGLMRTLFQAESSADLRGGMLFRRRAPLCAIGPFPQETWSGT